MGKKRKTKQLFISEAMSVHNNVYDYSKVEYVNAKTKVCIICPEHGEYLQTPDSHLRGSGCPKCGQIKKSEQFKIFINQRRDWDFEQPEEYKLVPLTQGKYAKVDNEDFDRVKDINWYYTSEGYVKNDNVGFIHRLIINAPDDMLVDHREGDKLDNRKKNLRICNYSNNSGNSSAKKGNSVYKGVCFYKARNKWIAQITHNYKNYHLGYYTNEIECAKAYDLKALELFGEFARLNFPELKEEYLKIILDN